jgi:hypothetical protein
MGKSLKSFLRSGKVGYVHVRYRRVWYAPSVVSEGLVGSRTVWSASGRRLGRKLGSVVEVRVGSRGGAGLWRRSWRAVALRSPSTRKRLATVPRASVKTADQPVNVTSYS